MKNVFIIAAISGFIATGAVAQTTAFVNQDASADAVEAIEDAIEDDRERDIGGFGNEGREIGNYGSLAMRGTAANNNGATSGDLGLGMRYGTFDGVNGFDITATYTYGDVDGKKSKDTLLAGIDYRRELTSSVFAYGKLEAFFDNAAADFAADAAAEAELLMLTEEVDPNIITQDVFVGGGIGYRIVNDADTQWSIQAGPGYRSTKFVVEDSANEAAASVSNNVFYSLYDTLYVTNDTDVIYSETLTTVNNNLALNVALTDTLSLRTGLSSVFDADKKVSEGVNTLGVSVIYNFN